MPSSTARLPKPFAHRPLQCRRLAYFPRSISTSTQVNTSTHASQPTTSRVRSFESRYPSTRTAHLRFWEPVHSIADVWVVKRALEKKYGAILETNFLKDFESPDRYQMIAFIIFRDLECLKRIPEAGEEFTVLAPEIPKKPIHEIGVKDLESYAGNDEFQPDFRFDKPEGDTTKRVIGGNIRRSPTEYTSNPDYRRLFQGTTQKAMRHFLNWGGFNPAQLDTSRMVQESDLFKPGARAENTRMIAALQLCSRVISEPIPQGLASTSDPTADEKTTQGPSLETARIFAGLYEKMPSSPLGRLRREEIDQEAAYFGEEIVTCSPSATISATVSPDAPPTLENQEPERTESSPSPSSQSSTTPFFPLTTPKPINRPPVSPEQKQKLENQLHAARLLQKATTPVRRKKAKPAVIEPANRPKLQQRLLDSSQAAQADPLVVEDKQEKKGFLAKLASLFGQ